MQCPSCKDKPLKATKLDGGLLGAACDKCNGALVSLLYYRDWAERTRGCLEEEGAPEVQAVDAKASLSCPKCARLMSKYKIGAGVGNALDLCPSCDEAWLDGGEWRLLRALELSHDVPKIFTDEWQRKVRKEASDAARRERMLKLLGEENLAKAEDVRSWLKNNPLRSEILFYLNQE